MNWSVKLVQYAVRIIDGKQKGIFVLTCLTKMLLHSNAYLRVETCVLESKGTSSFLLVWFTILAVNHFLRYCSTKLHCSCIGKGVPHVWFLMNCWRPLISYFSSVTEYAIPTALLWNSGSYLIAGPSLRHVRTNNGLWRDGGSPFAILVLTECPWSCQSVIYKMRVWWDSLSFSLLKASGLIHGSSLKFERIAFHQCTFCK